MKHIVGWIRRIALVCMAVGVCSGFSLGIKGYSVYREAVDAVSIEDKVEEIRGQESYTEFEDLPQVYVDAVVAVEDHRFYDHNGIDLIAICRAIVHDIQARAFVEGGSTIPQQLAKNMYFGQQKELSRKVAEVFVALQLKENYTDEEILELYVNSIYFGDGYYDVASASQGYFGKDVSEMSEYESTLLAGIPNAPSAYAPTKNPQLAAKRQLRVVKRMEECGYFSEDEAETVAETAAALIASAE